MKERGDTIIGDSAIKFGIEYRDLLSDQGVCIHVLGDVSEDDEHELLRFDCFDHEPHYHYGPQKRNERLMLDKTTAGDSLDWTLQQIRSRLPEMIGRAGYPELAEAAGDIDLGDAMDELEAQSRKLAVDGRSTVKHNRGDVILEAGPVRFGIEFRQLANDRGVAIHVLGDVEGEEQELLTFDCFERAPHYHYGPRAKNQRLYLDRTTVPDPLGWALDLFKGGKLGPMLDRAGYSDHASRLNPVLVADAVGGVETRSREIEAANAQ